MQEFTYLDMEIVERHLKVYGWGMSEFADAIIEQHNLENRQRQSGVVNRYSASCPKNPLKTLQRMKAERIGIKRSTAALMARTLGVNVLHLLSMSDSSYMAPPPDLQQNEWKHEKYLDHAIRLPNGLYYTLVKFRHREVPNRFARGKCYHLSHIPDAQRAAHQHLLVRHATVCDKIGVHANLANNRSCCPAVEKNYWWIIDTWVGEKCVEDFLLADSVQMTNEQIASILRQTATGLSVLHEAGVIARELTPWRILLTDDCSRAVITDFELAKLLENVVTVAGQWKLNSRYRAPEVKEGDATAAADLYSLAVIAAAMVNHQLPEKSQETACIQDSAMPTRLKEMLIKCLSPAHEDRIQKVGPLLAELKKWT